MNQKPITYDEAINAVGFGTFQRKLMVICGLGWAADAMEILIIAFVLPAIAAEWGITSGQRGLLASSIFMGMVAGAWWWGQLADRIGRKVGFVATIAVDSIFGFLSAFSPNFLVLLVLRTITGFGVGGTLPVDYSMFAEYLPQEKRGRYLVLLESFWALGTIVVAGLAWFLVPRFGWRALLVASAIPGLIILWIRRYVPESPRYLLVSGRAEEARAVLERVARENGTTLPPGELIAPPPQARGRVSDLFEGRLARTTVQLWAIWFLLSLGYYGVFTWLPSYFQAKGMALLPVYQNTFLLALAQLPGYFSAAWLVERWGRTRTMGVYLLGSAFFTFAFGLATSLNLVVAMAIWMSFFTLGAWGALYAYTPEAYPTTLRGTGMGGASGMARIAGVVAPILGGVLLGMALSVPLTVYAGAFALAGVAAFFLPQETGDQPLHDTLSQAIAVGGD